MENPPPNVAQVFQALGDPTRRTILERLGTGPASASGLAAPLGITLAAVVQHVQVLEDSGLVSTRKTGRVRICTINATGLAVAEQWLRARRPVWEARLDRLGDLLAVEPLKPSV